MRAFQVVTNLKCCLSKRKEEEFRAFTIQPYARNLDGCGAECKAQHCGSCNKNLFDEPEMDACDACGKNSKRRKQQPVTCAVTRARKVFEEQEDARPLD